MTLSVGDNKILYVDPNNQYFNLIQWILVPDVTKSNQKKVSMERSPSFYDCISRIKNKTTTTVDGLVSKNYDIIFCEYELWDGKTAQDLLEELRKKHLIPLSSVFIMIAAERFREKVMSVLEYAPDSYILKGVNTADDIERRINKAIKDRIDLLSIYEAIDIKDYKRALALCDEHIAANKRLKNHVMKLRWFVYLELHDYEKARTAYSEIIELSKVEEADGEEAKLKKPIPPYAKVWLAKANYFLWDKESAIVDMKSTMAENPEFMEWYDALAELYLSSWDTKSAQDVLVEATKKSPSKFDRQKLLWLVALDNEDYETAWLAFKKLTTDWKFSHASHPENFAHMAEIHIHKWELDDAMKMLRSSTDVFKKTDFEGVSRFCDAHVWAVLAEKKWDVKKAKELSDKALWIYKEGNSWFDSMWERLQQTVAMKFLDDWHVDVWAGLMENVIMNSSNKDSLSKRATKLWKWSSLSKFNELKERVEKSLTQTLDWALASFKGWNKESAMRIIRMLVEDSPRNPKILSKASMLYLMSVSSEDDIESFRKWNEYLNILIKVDSENPDIRMLSALSKRISEKFKLSIEKTTTSIMEVQNPDVKDVKSLTKLDDLLNSIKL